MENKDCKIGDYRLESREVFTDTGWVKLKTGEEIIIELKEENAYLKKKLEKLLFDKLYRCSNPHYDFMTLGNGWRINIRYCCEGHERDKNNGK